MDDVPMVAYHKIGTNPQDFCDLHHCIIAKSAL